MLSLIEELSDFESLPTEVVVQLSGAHALMLTEKYPADKETILKAIQEIIEQFNRGYSIPTDKRIVVESVEECIIIHSCLGSLTNRTLATLLGHLLAEKTGYVGVIEKAGGHVVVDTCIDEPCWAMYTDKVGMTDSPKCAYYRRFKEAVVSRLSDCVEAAVKGRWR